MDGQLHSSQWKRNAIFLVSKVLCEKAVKPEEIAALFDWRSNRVWYSVEGDVDAPEFERLARIKESSGGPSFRPGRWFCDDDELIQANGRTYAFSKMWGGDHWHKAMNLLKDTYPDLKIEFSPAE